MCALYHQLWQASHESIMTKWSRFCRSSESTRNGIFIFICIYHIMLSELVHGIDTFRSPHKQYSTCVVLRLFVVQYLLLTEQLLFSNGVSHQIHLGDHGFWWAGLHDSRSLDSDKIGHVQECIECLQYNYQGCKITPLLFTLWLEHIPKWRPTTI